MNDPMDLPANVLSDAMSQATSQAPLMPAKPSALRKVFIGADGLRAGWSLLIFILLMAVLFTAVSFINQRLHIFPSTPAPNAELPPIFAIFGEAIPFFITLLVTWIMSRIEGRPNSVYGLGGPRRVANFLAGLGWGVVCLSLLIFLLWKTGMLVFDRRLLFGAEALHYGLLWLLGFLMVGLLEEYLSRGYLLFTLTRGIAGLYAWIFKTPHSKSKALGYWTSAVLISILFGLGHGKNPGESPIGLLSAGLASLVFCLSLWRTGSLWWAIGIHTSWDWAQSFLYGVADSGLMVQHHFVATHPLGSALMSGGTTGPEGSILALLMLSIMCAIIVFTLPHTGYNDARSGTLNWVNKSSN